MTAAISSSRATTVPAPDDADAADAARVGVVVVAAGDGVRLGAAGPKALVEVAGQALVAHAVRLVADAGLPPPVVVHPPGRRADVVAALGALPVRALVEGGATRTASVRAGVAALADDVALVAVHDAARPLTPVEVVLTTVAAVRDDVLAAAPGLAVADTLKRVEDDAVVATVPRERLVGVQTPQVFPREVLRAALDAVAGSTATATDDLALVEQLVADGVLVGRVVVTPGSAWGHKVTTPDDLAIVEALARAAAEVDRALGTQVRA